LESPRTSFRSLDYKAVYPGQGFDNQVSEQWISLGFRWPVPKESLDPSFDFSSSESHRFRTRRNFILNFRVPHRSTTSTFWRRRRSFRFHRFLVTSIFLRFSRKQRYYGRGQTSPAPSCSNGRTRINLFYRRSRVGVARIRCRGRGGFAGKRSNDFFAWRMVQKLGYSSRCFRCSCSSHEGSDQPRCPGSTVEGTSGSGTIRDQSEGSGRAIDGEYGIGKRILGSGQPEGDTFHPSHRCRQNQRSFTIILSEQSLPQPQSQCSSTSPPKLFSSSCAEWFSR